MPKDLSTPLRIVAIRRIDISPKQPDIASAIGPDRGVIAATRNVSCGRRSQRAVRRPSRAVRAAQHAAATHPRPLARRRIEFPKIIQKADASCGICAGASEEPEIAALVSPTHRVFAAARNIGSGSSAQRAVNARLSMNVASAHPGPLAGRRIELPEVAEIAAGSVGVVAIASKDPEVAAAVLPLGRGITDSRNVAGAAVPRVPYTPEAPQVLLPLTHVQRFVDRLNSHSSLKRPGLPVTSYPLPPNSQRFPLLSVHVAG